MERVPKETGKTAKPVTQGKSATHIAQGDMDFRLGNSPMMVAQRKKFQSLFGGAAQLKGAEEDPLQGQFNAVQRAGEEELLQKKHNLGEEEFLPGKFGAAQRVEDEEPLQGKFETAQRVGEEEPLQGKFETAQRVEDEEPVQGKFTPESHVPLEQQYAHQPNNTGLPDNLKSGIENLSGMSMNNVKVHYNSSQPAQLNALAYAQGTDIHVAPGQEQHLPHEAWHVVQQAQGRVQPTTQMKGGVPVNDDKGLEREADVMGGKALQMKGAMHGASSSPARIESVGGGSVAQRYILGKDLEEVKKGEIDDTSRVSNGGNIIWNDKNNVFASEEMFQQANAILKDKSDFLLAMGGARNYEIILGLYNERFKTSGDFFEVVPKVNPQKTPAFSNYMPGMKTSEENTTSIFEAYKSALETIPGLLVSLKNTLIPDWAGEKTETVQSNFIQWGRVDHPILNTIAFEKLWEVILPWSSEARTGILFFKKRQTADIILKIEMVESFAKKVIEKEIEAGENGMITPNDCKKMAESIVGGYGNIRKVDSTTDTPGIGENYYTSLSLHKDIERGWTTHYAGVVMSDSEDRLTFETAASDSAPSFGKQNAYFNLYGTKKKEQTFKRQTHLAHHLRNRGTLFDQSRRGTGSVEAFGDAVSKTREIENDSLEKSEKSRLFE